MMELPKGFSPPQDTMQVLIEAPGFIKQCELRAFVEVRNQLELDDPDLKRAFEGLKALANLADDGDPSTQEVLDRFADHAR